MIHWTFERFDWKTNMCHVPSVQCNSYSTVYMSAEQKKENKPVVWSENIFKLFTNPHWSPLVHASFYYYRNFTYCGQRRWLSFFFLFFLASWMRIYLHNCYNSKYLLVVKILRMDLMKRDRKWVRWRKRKRWRRWNMKWKQYCGLGNK